MSSNFKITYSALNADLTQLHLEFDRVYAQVHSEMGREIPSMINGKAVKTGVLNKKYNPAQLNELVAAYHTVTPAHLDEAFAAAKKAQKQWAGTPWQERVRITQKAADVIRSRKMKIAALMTLEVGKNRMESLGDAEESADLLSYYAQQMIDANGFIRPLGKLSPNENTQDTLRPYGVFSVLAPFNFPMALSAGMAAAAILGGNAAILKPSDDAPGTALELYEAYQEAGLPTGILQVVFGHGPALGQAMVSHPLNDGVAFTGSNAVGMSILRTLNAGPFAKPVLMELGGKNPTFVCETANLDKSAQGCMRSAFGLTGQKCSALSKIYVHDKVYDAFVEKLIAQAKAVKIGNPAKQEIYMGPIINEKALDRFLLAVKEARQIGKVLHGGQDLRSRPEYKNGHFIEPAIVEVPRTARHFTDEFFAPLIALTRFTDLSEAIDHANTAHYGLTAGIFTEDKSQIDYFMNHIEAGILYANRQTGATTGAWPGVQSFCGWKGSGGTGKGGCGPYYVSQFMREQSRTIME